MRKLNFATVRLHARHLQLAHMAAEASASLYIYVPPPSYTVVAVQTCITSMVQAGQKVELAQNTIRHCKTACKTPSAGTSGCRSISKSPHIRTAPVVHSGNSTLCNITAEHLKASLRATQPRLTQGLADELGEARLHLLCLGINISNQAGNLLSHGLPHLIILRCLQFAHRVQELRFLQDLLHGRCKRLWRDKVEI